MRRLLIIQRIHSAHDNNSITAFGSAVALRKLVSTLSTPTAAFISAVNSQSRAGLISVAMTIDTVQVTELQKAVYIYECCLLKTNNNICDFYFFF